MTKLTLLNKPWKGRLGEASLPNGKPEQADPRGPLRAGSNAGVRLSRASHFLFLISLLLSGCATPHRINETTHTIKKYAGRSDGLIASEEWRDYHKAGANFFFSDPASQGFCDKYTNQPDLGGGGWFMAAPFTVTVDSNLVPAITATGTAVGNVVGAAVKAAAK